MSQDIAWTVRHCRSSIPGLSIVWIGYLLAVVVLGMTPTMCGLVEIVVVVVVVVVVVAIVVVLSLIVHV